MYVVEKNWQFVNGIIRIGALNFEELTSLDLLLNIRRDFQ